MAKKPPSQSPSQGQAVATYFLAKHSGLFQAGHPTILANTLKKEKGNDHVQKQRKRLR
jgi:hypothetical protein